MPTIEEAVARWIASSLRPAIDDALPSVMPTLAPEYVKDLEEQAPSQTRDVHIYSHDITRRKYRVSVSGATAVISNVRMRSESPGRRPKRDEDVATYINEGYTTLGARTARSFRVRGIGDAYHLISWRQFLARLPTLTDASGIVPAIQRGL